MSQPSNPLSPKKAGLSKLKRYLKDNTGVSAMMTAITFPALLLVGGIAIDTAIVTREQPIFYQAVDNAALAVASNELSIIPDNLSASQKAARQSDMEDYARKFLEANYKGVVDNPSSLDLDLVMTGQRVDIDVKLEIPTSISSLFGIDSTTLHANTTVMRAMRPIELSLVLDTTGSMRNDMTALKTATNQLISTLYSDPSPTSKNMSSQYIRMGLVPFSGAVRLDPNGHDFSFDMIDRTGLNPLSHINFTDPTWNNYTAWGKLRSNSTTPMVWNGCVESRTALAPDGGNYITMDVPPDVSNPDSLFPAFFSPDSPSWYPGSSSQYPTNTSGSTKANGRFFNEYIDAYASYSTTIDNSLLAPTGSRRTGYDDSTVGKNAYSLNSRWKNQAKYDGKVITPETFTSSSGMWSVNNGPWLNCTGSAVVPMTHDRSKIEAGITAMKAIGGTNIAEGLAWGMRVLSPTAPFTQVEGVGSIPSAPISPYNGPRWQKILVLMTDGENDPYVSGGALTDTGTAYNSFGASTTPSNGTLNRYGVNTTTTTQHNALYGNAGIKLDSYTAQMCNNLKANGVTIYTVGFRVDNAAMKSCATSPAHYKYVTSTAELITYFNGIGQDVLNKMVYIAN